MPRIGSRDDARHEGEQENEVRSAGVLDESFEQRSWASQKRDGRTRLRLEPSEEGLNAEPLPGPPRLIGIRGIQACNV